MCVCVSVRAHVSVCGKRGRVRERECGKVEGEREGGKEEYLMHLNSS